jgi:hypothetical protein
LSPPRTRVPLLAQALGVSPDYLLRGSGKAPEVVEAADAPQVVRGHRARTKSQALADVRLYAPWWHDEAKKLLDTGADPDALAEAIRWVLPEISANTKKWRDKPVSKDSIGRVNNIMRAIIQFVTEDLVPASGWINWI